ncbi:uncharacterized protein [Temnothorax longispinosus]|uniref:uncharacterized protein isoform X2 n=1 Tax=Temnothorax longispinosus TaxID=300112 RepID=UPI003A99CFEE
MSPNASHKCAYTSDGEVTLQSLADAVCFLGNQLWSCKLMLKVTDKTINSFIESELLNNKNAPKEQPLLKKHSNLMDTFPLLTMDEFKAVEKKLKNDDTYRFRLIESLRGEVVGDTLQRRINSVMQIIFDDLASLFNWKGQRGEKQKLTGHRINKVMIEIVAEKFPKINETIFGRKAGTWLFQAPSRIQKKKCNNNGGDEKEDMESDNDCDADRCNNNGDDEEKYTKSDDDCDASKSSDASKSDNKEINF